MFEKMRRQIEKASQGAKSSGSGSSRFTVKSVTAMVLFGAIILVFVFFGMPTRNSGQGGIAWAGQVNNKIITLNDFRRELARVEQMYSMFGGLLGDDAKQQIRAEALETLINSELISQTAEQHGVLATDEEIRDFIIKEIPQFQQDGRFSREMYMGLLQANQLTPSDFESSLRKDLRGKRIRLLMSSATVPMQMEIEKAKKLKSTQINVQFARLDREDAAKKISVSEGEISAALAREDFVGRAKSYFSVNPAEFKIQEEVKAQHILIKTQPGDSDSDQKALERIKAIQERLKKEDFSKVAADVSEDAGSKSRGGDLGFFSRGRMMPEFETAAFTQKVGEVGAPVKTAYGYHIIKVTAHTPARERSFDEVRSQIAKKLLAQDKFDEGLKKVESALSAGDSGAVQAAVKMMGGNFDETGFFDMTSPVAPKMASQLGTRAAWELSSGKPWLSRVVQDGNVRYVLKLKDTKSNPDATLKPETLVAQLERERAGELLEKWVLEKKKSANIQRNVQLIQNR